jgi:hypothetical protein
MLCTWVFLRNELRLVCLVSLPTSFALANQARPALPTGASLGAAWFLYPALYCLVQRGCEAELCVWIACGLPACLEGRDLWRVLSCSFGRAELARPARQALVPHVVRRGEL